jgi:hypothetical protein
MSTPDIAAQKAKTLNEIDQAIDAITPVNSELSTSQGEIDKAWKMWKTDLHNTLTRKAIFQTGRKPRTLLSLIDKDFGRTYMKVWRAAPSVVKWIGTSSVTTKDILGELKMARADIAAINAPKGTPDPTQLANLKIQVDRAWGSADQIMRTAVNAIEVKAPKIGKAGLKLIVPAIRLIKMLIKKVNARIKKLSGRKLVVIAKKKRLSAMKKTKKRITRFLKQAVIGEQKIRDMLEKLPRMSRGVRSAHTSGSGFMALTGTPITPLPTPKAAFKGSSNQTSDIGFIMGQAILNQRLRPGERLLQRMV